MTPAVPSTDETGEPGDAAPGSAVVDLLRRYGTESTRLAQAFAARQGLQHADIRALVAIMDAERAGEPLTPGRLARLLRLSSAGTSYVIDRLEAAGHVRRSRDEERDSRIVHLRYTLEAFGVAHSFFGPLGVAVEQVLADFDGAEIAAITRFLARACEVVEDYVVTVESADG